MSGFQRPSRDRTPDRVHPAADPTPAVETAQRIPRILRHPATGAPQFASTPDTLRYLQRTVGNQAVARLLGRGGQDAPSVQREAPVRQEAAQIAYANGGSLSPTLEQDIQRARSGGSKLDKNLRGGMEGAFGTGFGAVRLHTDRKAEALNRSLDSQAFTTGRDIFFRRDSYRPDTPGGQQLIAHELTHVVQQSGGVQRDMIQRNIGFEFEVGNFRVEQLSGRLTRNQKDGTDKIWNDEIDNSELAKGQALLKKDGFEMQLDEGDDYHLEFVTDAPGFPEGKSGRKALIKTMTSMTKTAQKVKEITNKSPMRRGETEFNVASNKMVGGKATSRDHIIYDGVHMEAEPQTTAGVRLDQLARLMETVLTEKGVVNELSIDTNLRTPGRFDFSSKSSTDAKTLGAAPARARNAIQTYGMKSDKTEDEVPNGYGSEELVGLLALIGAYLNTAKERLHPYPKVLAALMARTDFAQIFRLLPDADRYYFTAKPERFVKLALDAANMDGTKDIPVFTNGFSNLGGNDQETTKQISDKLQQLSHGDWLDGIVRGVDKLTEAYFPDGEVRGWMMSLGTLGSKTEEVGTKKRGNRTQAPIFEFRRMRRQLNYEDWFGFALDVFDFLDQVNDLKYPVYSRSNQERLEQERKAKKE